MDNIKSSENWMLDDTRNVLSKGLNGKQLEHELTIQKIEYGRECIYMLYCDNEKNDTSELRLSLAELDSELKKAIEKMGATPKEIKIVVKSK